VKRNTAIMLIVLMMSAGNALAQDTDAEKPAGGWSGEGELGYSSTTGNTETQSLTAKLGLNKEVARWLHSLTLEATNKEDAGVRTAERYYAAGKSDYSYTERDYVYANLDYEKDRFSGYNHRSNVGLGYGRKVIDNEALKLNLEIGPGYRWSELDDGSEENEATLRLAGDLAWQISESSAFTQELAVITGEKDTTTRSLSALTTKINSILSLRISYLINHRTDPPPDTENTDTETAVTLVYGF